jgi:hypothetical protein
MRNTSGGVLKNGILATALLAAIMLIYGQAQAMPIGAAKEIRTVADGLKLTESVQYVWNGRKYCWYESGWKGPGWYVCSYGPWVSGLWWGGGYGWRGWYWHGQRHAGGKYKRPPHVAHHGGKYRRPPHVQHYGGKRRGLKSNITATSGAVVT